MKRTFLKITAQKKTYITALRAFNGLKSQEIALPPCARALSHKTSFFNVTVPNPESDELREYMQVLMGKKAEDEMFEQVACVETPESYLFFGYKEEDEVEEDK